ncbi:hypothetical protein LJB84_02760, partial [Bacteroidales bacterium OttesenSCG-928-J19]|nr:hypothetical protein [Bacteroidales bacterium OttesenSCG-928-J19]
FLSQMLVYQDYYKRFVENQTFVNRARHIYSLKTKDESGNKLKQFQCCQDINLKIRQLSSRIRIPFCLYIAGYSYEEISRKLSLQTKVTQALIQKASLELENINT